MLLPVAGRGGRARRVHREPAFVRSYRCRSLKLSLAHAARHDESPSGSKPLVGGRPELSEGVPRSNIRTVTVPHEFHVTAWKTLSRATHWTTVPAPPGQS